MDPTEFRRILELFPVVRSPDYCEDPMPSRQSTSHSTQDELNEWQDAWDERDGKQFGIQGADQHDAFWRKLKSVAERKVGTEEAERFCKAFQRIHEKLVYEGLSAGAARSFINSS